MAARKTAYKKSVLTREVALTIGEKKFKVFIYLENRYDCRAAVGLRGIHFRLSRYMTKDERTKHFRELLQWAKEYIIKHQLYKSSPKYRNYREGDIFKIYNREFLIKINYDDKNASKGLLKNGIMHLTLSKGMSGKEEQHHKSFLVSKLTGNEFLPIVKKRLEELNAIYFKKKIKNVAMRNNVSCWGSCSWDGNIVISTRLLFAPREVIDYIFIHELAHLVEHNHSDRFWKLVEKTMPGYMQCEKWLEKNGNRCIF